MTQRTPIVVDRWGLRFEGEPGDLGEAVPASWIETWQQVNRHLMRLVSGVPRLLAEAVEGAARLARMTRKQVRDPLRLMATRTVASTLEKQQLPGEVSRERRLEAGRRIVEILERYRAEGHVAEVVMTPDGVPAVVILPGAGETVPAQPPLVPVPVGSESGSGTGSGSNRRAA